MSNEIDLFKYGQLVNQVDNMEKKFDSMEKKMDKMELQMEELLALANKGRGGFWAGMAIVSAISSFIGFLAHILSSK
jgi:hypothetical protein